jgi:hypothetical protein
VVQEVVGLGFERIGAHGHDRIGEFRVLVAVVQFTHAHVAGRMDFGIVGRPVVDADVLHLHSTKIKFPGAPGIFVAAAGAAVIERRDEQAIFTHAVDDADRDARNQIERIVPTCGLHLPIAPHHRIGEPLQLRVACA